ncbi:class I SAM-dependent methyltransferase [Lachnospiraceae bacterium 45-W7]
MKDHVIDQGRNFDFGRTSADYARYRDIYPGEFYQKLLNEGLCVQGQRVLDIGTGTGVLPRNLYDYGAEFTGIDSSQNQIAHAVMLAEQFHMNITFQCVPAEQMKFQEESFDVVTACQCFTYFKHEELAPLICKLLKPGGVFAVLYMAWLPFEDEVAGKSEELILKYNPAWTGCREKRHVIDVPEVYRNYFEIEKEAVFDCNLPFDRESWHGRIKTCRGVGASLSSEELELFELEHQKLLRKIAPEQFQVLHYAAMTFMKKR